MRWILLTLLAILMTFGASAQSFKGTGILYWNSFPNQNATLPYGSEWSYVLSNKTLHYWDRDSTRWIPYYAPGRIFTINTVADTSSLSDVKEGSIFISNNGYLGFKDNGPWRITSTGATRSIYVGSGRVPSGTEATVTSDFRIETEAGVPARIIWDEEELELGGAVVSINGLIELGSYSAPPGDTLALGVNDAGDLVYLTFPTTGFIDSLINASGNGVDTFYMSQDTLVLQSGAEFFRVRVLATSILFNNAGTGLSATNIQTAIAELALSIVDTVYYAGDSLYVVTPGQTFATYLPLSSGTTDTLIFAATTGTPISRTNGETLTIVGAGTNSTSTSGSTLTVTGSVTSGSFMGSGTAAQPLNVYGLFISDTAAGSGGVPLGGVYQADIGNSYGLPRGSLRVRIN